jgi:uncharacterized membrane protein YqjE
MAEALLRSLEREEVERYGQCSRRGMAMTKKAEPEVFQARISYGAEDASTADIVRRAFEETKELVRIEVELAKNEASLEIEQAKAAAIGFSIALAAAVLVLCMVAVAVVIALGGTVAAALGVAGVFFVIGGIAALLGYSAAPKKPFDRVRARLETDVKQLKEHVA